jgi:hypothetical protein
MVTDRIVPICQSTAQGAMARKATVAGVSADNNPVNDPYGTPLRGRVRALPENIRLRCKWLGMTLCTSLQYNYNYPRISIIEEAPGLRRYRGVYYKTSYGSNLRIFVISWSVCPWQALPA